MIILDTETTGLVQPDLVPLDQQPYIIEIGMLKLDPGTLEEVARYSTLIKPPIPLPEIITKITGLTDADLANERPFAEVLPEVEAFMLGTGSMVAHNMPFDKAMLRMDLQRIGRELFFPWPPKQICTVEATMHLKGKRLKLQQLYEFLFGSVPEQSHRGMADVELLATCVRELRTRGIL